MKRIATAILLAALVISLCGCSGMFEKEYVVVEDYIPAAPQETFEDEKVVVKSFAALKQAILNFVVAGMEEGSIVFDSDYNGNASEDLASACWQIRTQNALCAYCVDNISYELSRIVAYDEAAVHIRYADFGGKVEDIVRLTFSTELEELLLKAIEESRSKLEVYILNGTYTAEQIENLASRVYRQHPVSAPREPRLRVNVYSGTGMQRLYAIEFDYRMTAEELAVCRGELAELNLFENTDTVRMDAGQKALAACSYLTNNCRLSDEAQDNSAYSALVKGEGNSEGLALAYVELCHRLGLDCQIVYGQKDWENHCWNIVSIMDNNYHVDVTQCMRLGMRYGFLLNDQMMWSNCRWDMSSYLSCTGDLSYEQVAGIDETLPEASTDEPTLPPENEDESTSQDESEEIAE